MVSEVWTVQGHRWGFPCSREDGRGYGDDAGAACLGGRKADSASTPIVHAGPVLRGQIFGVCRRGMGSKQGRERSGNRDRPKMPAGFDRTDRKLREINNGRE